jgi:uncharacterized protein
MTKSIFINLPVTDLARSAAFYEAIGFVRDPAFSSEHGASLIWSDSVRFMLTTHDFFRTMVPLPVADLHAAAAGVFCLAMPDRAAVDAITEAAGRAGGRADLNAPDELPFMYGRSFADPDGHLFGPMWMDVDAMLAAQSAAATEPVAA